MSSQDVRFTAAPRALAIHICDAATGAKVRVIPQTAGEVITSFSVSPDGRRLASAGSDSKVKIWDPETGQELLKLVGHAS
jgi:WD40 repeat protein